MYYLFLWCLALFEFANVYFIMPIPGSQEMDSIALAYFLYRWRWVFRILFLTGMAFTLKKAWTGKKWRFFLFSIPALAVVFMFNGPMTAAQMFRPLKAKTFAGIESNRIPGDRLVVGVKVGNEARAYPVQMMGYHHRVTDTINGQVVFVTYCTVCHTGRVFSPVINGKTEEFRLVGMDHYNAMFEDATTGSWWRQATGEYCAGELKGQKLPEIPFVQMTLNDWFRENPEGVVLQYDPAFTKQYKDMEKYETGKSKSRLTRIDTGSWQEKSLVLGVLGRHGSACAYDWNRLLQRGFIADTLEGRTFVILLHPDNTSFSGWYVNKALEEVSAGYFKKGVSVLETKSHNYDFTGKAYAHSKADSATALQPMQVYQEYWHSWREFRGERRGRFRF